VETGGWEDRRSWDSRFPFYRGLMPDATSAPASEIKRDEVVSKANFSPSVQSSSQSPLRIIY
jgi:hypothetical protein